MPASASQPGPNPSDNRGRNAGQEFAFPAKDQPRYDGNILKRGDFVPAVWARGIRLGEIVCFRYRITDVNRRAFLFGEFRKLGRPVALEHHW